MRLRSFLLRPRCLGSCSAGSFPGICWGFAVRGSCFLYSFLCSSLGLGPYSYLYSSGLGCYSSNGGRLMSCTVGRFVLEDGGCSIEGVTVGERKLRSFYFLRTRFGAVPSSGH